MIGTSKKSHLLAIAAALSLGLVTGTGVALAAESDADHIESAEVKAFAAGKYRAALPEPKALRNGKSAGGFRPETPVADRPEYTEVTLADGTTAYVKWDDMFFIPVFPRNQKGPIHITDEEMAEIMRQHDRIRSRANAKGEIWADAYAEDGTTVVGKFFVGDAN